MDKQVQDFRFNFYVHCVACRQEWEFEVTVGDLAELAAECMGENERLCFTWTRNGRTVHPAHAVSLCPPCMDKEATAYQDVATVH